jgi:hypothetical protein
MGQREYYFFKIQFITLHHDVYLVSLFHVHYILFMFFFSEMICIDTFSFIGSGDLTVMLVCMV